jgi:hypothetical protein
VPQQLRHRVPQIMHGTNIKKPTWFFNCWTPDVLTFFSSIHLHRSTGTKAFDAKTHLLMFSKKKDWFTKPILILAEAIRVLVVNSD